LTGITELDAKRFGDSRLFQRSADIFKGYRTSLLHSKRAMEAKPGGIAHSTCTTLSLQTNILYSIKYFMNTLQFRTSRPPILPGAPLFRRLEREGRILHRDWSRYDTCQAVFIPRLMSPERLEQGYRWCYHRLFSPGSIWRRRPPAGSEIPAYLAASLLYKKMNLLWPLWIRMRATHAVWSPLIRLARRYKMARRRTPVSYPADRATQTVESQGWARY
jgi:hypothetical protein